MALTAITAGEGQALALAYGEHMVAGHVIVNQTFGGRALLLALGEGPWDSCVDLYYKGEKLDRSAYHFHPGTLSTGPTDPVQGIDSFYPTNSITFNRTAYIAIRLPDEFDEVDPSGFVGRYRCLVINDYDEEGRQIGASVSANPARVFADLWIRRAKRDPNRIDWPSWYAWKQFCDQNIPWNDGKDATRTIPRFQAHVVFTTAVELIDAISILTELSATTWQDTGSKIVFYSPNSQSTDFTFDESVIVERSVRVYTTDRRSLPTFVRINFRDLDNEFLAPAQWMARNDEGLESRGTVGLGDVQFGPMTYSQAMRLARYYLKRAASTYERCDLEAFGESLAVLPGDYVKVNHALTGGEVDAEVLEVEDLASETDSRKFVLALRRPNLYSDLDHEPAPTQLEVQAVS